MAVRTVDMRALLIVFGLAALPLFGQQNPFIGFVQRVAGNEIQVLTPTEPFTIFIDAKTAVWNGGDAHGTPRTGDTIRVRYSRGLLGRLTAVEIQTRVEFSGFVDRVLAPRVFQMTTRGEGSSRLVYVSPRTDFEFGGRPVNDGDHVLVVGWDLGNGKLDAIRVALYNTDMPIDTD